MIRTGVDVIEIARVKAAVDRYGAHLLNRVFTSAELTVCRDRAESLASRFAAKEAVAKALGTGIWRSNICWTDIETLRTSNGAPLLLLHRAAAARAETLGLAEWSLSLSHDRERAIAFVVAMSNSCP